jgi:amino acid adenylation domain-containing protein
MKSNPPGQSIQDAFPSSLLQHQFQGNQEIDRLTFWKQQLSDSPQALDLPVDYPHSPNQIYTWAFHPFKLPAPLSVALNMLGQREDVSLFAILFTAFLTLLYRYTGQEDLLVGTTGLELTQSREIYSRNTFVNPLVLRTRLAGSSTILAALGRVQQVLLEGLAYQDIPFEQVVEFSLPERDLSRTPLYQVLFVMEQASSKTNKDQDQLSIQSMNNATNNSMVPVDLALFVQTSAQEIRGKIEYNSDLFKAETIARMVGHLQKLVEGIVAGTDQLLDALPLLTDAEWQQQIVRWNATQTSYPQHQCFHELFEAVVEQVPDAVAISFELEQLTYGELNRRANQLAHYLRNLGVGPETLVSLLSERGPSIMIALLAVFKAGGAYLPLDPHHPPARLRRVLEHSDSRFILAARDFTPVLSEVLTGMETEVWPTMIYLEDLQFLNNQDEDNLPINVTPGNLAYVIYTSGSTGMPKGAMIEHMGMLNHIYAKINGLQLTAADHVAQTASQCFDISVWQMLAILLVGGCVHIFPDRVTHNPADLLEQVNRHAISIFETVPSLLRAMLEVYEADTASKPPLKELRWLIPTGEALPADLCRRWLYLYPEIPLLNAYGPTECSDDVTHHPIYSPPAETESTMPIGQALMNTQLYVLNPLLVPVPVQVIGELYVGGAGVGRGYLHDEQRTAQSFIPDPFCSKIGAKLYKTGDLARFLPDGTLDFLGRIDHQIKIRGYRIELGEIEMVMKLHPDVRDVVVVAREVVPGDKRLVAYVVLYNERPITVRDLQNHLVKQLPDYMIPSAFVLLETLPLNANGKVDRQALPAPVDVRTEVNENDVVLTLSIHEHLKLIWEELLDARPIGIRDNFFDLGGHSLLAARLVSRIEQDWGKKIPLDILLANATIEQLAEVLSQPEKTTNVSSTQGPSLEEKKQSSRIYSSLFERLAGVMQRRTSRVSGSRSVNETHILADEKDQQT